MVVRPVARASHASAASHTSRRLALRGRHFSAQYLNFSSSLIMGMRFGCGRVVLPELLMSMIVWLDL